MTKAIYNIFATFIYIYIYKVHCVVILLLFKRNGLMKQREREKRNVLVVFFQKYPNICIYVFYNVINIYNYGYFTDVEIVLMKKMTENEIYSIIIIAMKKEKV